MPEPIVTATMYAVSCLPIDHPDNPHYRVAVRRRSGGQWVVSDGFDFYDPTGAPSAEPWPMERGDALELAKRIAPKLVVNGRTVTDVLARGGW
ncbi:hypothetical protein [Nocardia sp. NPDC046763]|uniref:hypothetical protein n=1 Tax=Nocardia sp. NPDC046763 TaxID=3155256 RepID=UPI0034052579